MTHWIILPLILPPMIAAIILLAYRNNPHLARWVSMLGVVAFLIVAMILLWQSTDGTIRIYRLGDWPVPFGIVLVQDRLSALMVALTAVLAVAVVLYAIGSGWDQRGRHFHALLQFQIMGTAGAFLTGDIFNLFVFFEVLLIASYGLMVHGGGERRLQAGVQYVVFNLLGSTLFLFALGIIYAVAGTLNMADLAVRLAAMPVDQSALIRVGAIMLFLVFALKAALLPLHVWLPATYEAAPAPVAALFAVMTKVGVYAIIRTQTLIFGTAPVTEGLLTPWLLPLALLTLVVGMIGVLGSRNLGRIAAFAAIGSMGTVMIAVSVFTPAGLVAALYYMIHSTLAGAALFLIVDLVRTGRGSDLMTPAPAMAQAGLIGALFLATAIGVAGMPPLSGFIGKLLILDAARGAVWTLAIWAIILTGSLCAVVGFARAGSMVFWNMSAGATVGQGASRQSIAALGGLLAGLILLTVFAGPVTAVLTATADQLFDPAALIAATLQGGAE